ncbi:hypothetical protein NDU88_001566 [Pleurodeles waltl]|uniref:Uncharacterized protein n=1 Tax=Pleurodeles waltl TaxID=8319 RepID=A0AAV7SZJ7_PLEWA|nr:hypothetical protein NDU88_001566 [Pleurodeles waltl]
MATCAVQLLLGAATNTIMTTNRSKNDTTVRDMFSKPTPKKAEQQPLTPPGTSSPMSDTEAAILATEETVTHTFLETLFGTLSDDIAALRRDMAADVKYIKRELSEMGQCIDTLETTSDQGEGELNVHQQERLELHDKKEDLYYRLEDLKNRLRHSKIQIKGVPMQADSGSFEDYLIGLFRHVARMLVDKDIILDCMHRTGRPAKTPGAPKIS